MKQRFGFVSNSSSSSFILDNSKSIRHLTSDDWYEMLIDLYPEYEEQVKKHRKCAIEENYGDYIYPFAVFDLLVEREQANDLLSHFDGWNATRCVLHNGVLKKVSYCPESKWEKIAHKKALELEKKYTDDIRYCTDVVNIGSIDDLRNGNCYIIVLSKNRTKRIAIDAKTRKELLLEAKKIGLCNNKDVLLNKAARFAFHFSENEYCCISGIDDRKGNWETEEYSYPRLCEIMANWLVSHNKVHQGFTYRNLITATLTCVMHEG